MRRLALPVALLASGAALAHSWYPSRCCSDRDCLQVKGEPVAGGYRFVHAGKEWIVPEDKTLPSEDGFYHLCQPTYAEKPVCYFAPRAGA